MGRPEVVCGEYAAAGGGVLENAGGGETLTLGCGAGRCDAASARFSLMAGSDVGTVVAHHAHRTVPRIARRVVVERLPTSGTSLVMWGCRRGTGETRAHAPGLRSRRYGVS